MAHPGSGDGAAQTRSPLWKRAAWLFVIWLASVSTVLIAAEIIKFCMAAAGLKTH
ncbi:DUF2474 domain-containing protein [Paraburkholderia sp. Cpub6]|uniref:DUF2474 domain-containing protein n=1 Tax=Paraburkholderia sp. Cpub6 TaxID=2723094 RepID=UPI001609D332|nr:DUF2474 domain-containing protein [Paraburkholderia sp. Cpub6]MBB5463629.1 hypothetical protein [Paraburkholderia sp. Cpub6]